MIALISSTIFPENASENTLYRGLISPQERLEQTIETINSLKKLDFSEIYLIDNSGLEWNNEVESLLKPAVVLRLNSFQFVNKGISEIYMLLHGLSTLPDETPIFKISGRYTLEKKLDDTIFSRYDFAGKFCDKSSNISTRGYYVKNKKILASILQSSLNYLYAYPHKIVGPGSFKRVVRNAFKLNLKDNFYDPTVSIERGMYIALKNYQNLNLETLYIRGIQAGPLDSSTFIDE